jgi:hypothetical protein
MLKMYLFRNLFNQKKQIEICQTITKTIIVQPRFNKLSDQYYKRSTIKFITQLVKFERDYLDLHRFKNFAKLRPVKPLQNIAVQPYETCQTIMMHSTKRYRLVRKTHCCNFRCNFTFFFLFSFFIGKLIPNRFWKFPYNFFLDKSY